jgi:hypothetical protein
MFRLLVGSHVKTVVSEKETITSSLDIGEQYLTKQQNFWIFLA